MLLVWVFLYPVVAMNVLLEGLRILLSGEVAGYGISSDVMVVDAGGMPVACGPKTQGCQLEGCQTWLAGRLSCPGGSSKPVESGIKDEAGQSIVDNTVSIETPASEAPTSAPQA